VAANPFEIIHDGGPHGLVVTIVLDQPDRPVVVLDADLIQRLDATLDAVPPDARGLVLATSGERAFVAGADLRSIQQMPDDRLHAYLERAAGVFHRLSQLPYPTAAAIDGAALGGGLELAMHCDGLIGAPAANGKPYPIGLPEAGLGICPGWGGTNLLPARIDPATAIRRTAEGTPLKYDEAAEAGLFDRVVDDPASVGEAAADWVLSQDEPGRTGRDGAPSKWIGRAGLAATVLAALEEIRADLPETLAAEAVAACVDVGLTQGWAAAIEAEQGHLVRLRGTEPAQEAIAAFLDRSK